MEIQGRCFPYEKSIVINALYDTIEALGLRLDSSDSEMGTLIVSDVGRTGSMHIALDNSVHAVGTQVNLHPKDPNTTVFDIWGLVLLDELFGTIQRALCIKRADN